MFAKHRHGHIFPVLLNVNPLNDSFVGIIQKLNCSSHFIWFYSKSFVICGASRESLHMLGVCTRACGDA